MFELVINKNTYQFNFGFGFVKDLDPTVTQPIEGVKGQVQNMGVHFAIAKLIDGDIFALIDVLKRGNKGFTPRLEEEEIVAHIENLDTNIEEMFDTVLGFFEKSNFTKKKTKELKEYVEKEKAKQNQTA